jgi:hypothetical protein
MYPQIQTKRVTDYQIENNIIQLGTKGYPTTVENMKCEVNFNAFYNELRDVLVNNSSKAFVDILNDPDTDGYLEGHVKAGEHVDNEHHLNRTADMFEKHFQWEKTKDAVNFEMKWKARVKTPHSKYGWCEVEIDLVNRFLNDKEILVGNTKQTVQGGSWEFRNKIKYFNNIIPKYLQTLPIVKNSASLQQLYIDHVHYNLLVSDIEACVLEVEPLIYSVINKHFKK